MAYLKQLEDELNSFAGEIKQAGVCGHGRFL